MADDPLLPRHRDMLEKESGIDSQVIRERGYYSAVAKKDLEEVGFGPAQRRVPTLVVPVHGVVAGETPWYLHRPDEPRLRNGRVVKYEIPQGRKMALDIHPRVRRALGDPAWPLFVTEGSKKADSLITAGA